MHGALQALLVDLSHRRHLHRCPRRLFSVSCSQLFSSARSSTDTHASIFVGVPKIAQSKMNDAKLEIQGVNILDTTSDSYTMEINSTITTDGSIHAKVDGFQGNLYLEDLEPHTPFATIDFPDTTSDKHQDVNVSQAITITDMDAFIDYNVWFVNNKTLKLTVEGKTKVKPRGLSKKYDVDFKKTIEVTALNLFEGTEVLDGEIELGSGDEDANARNFHGRSKIPNASHFTLDIVSRLLFLSFWETTRD